MYAVMLAKKFDPDRHDPTGWLMSEKLDGVRAYWDGYRFHSRGGKIYNAPDWFTKNLPENFHLDGELWLDRGKGMFDKASGIVRRKEPTDDWADLTFLVFDAPKVDGGFEMRMGAAKDVLKSSYAKIVDQEVCENMEHLQDKMKEILKLKGEGIMLREAGSPYIRSRSGHLLKVKKFYDDEAMIYDIQEGTGKYEGMMGALLVYWIPRSENEPIVRTGTSSQETVAFKIGTGFSDEDREVFFERSRDGTFRHIGKVVSFAYQEITVAGVPRFPAYLGLKI